MNTFIDTSAFIALTNKSDQFHKKAVDFVKQLDKGVQFYTTNYILDESFTRIRMMAGLRESIIFGKNVFAGSLYKIYYIDKELEKDAFEIFKKYNNLKLSFTDCTSFALMKKLNLISAFTFDEDFLKVGFNMIP